MKSKIAGAVLFAVMSTPVLAFAGGVTCAPSDHPVYAADDVTITSCISDVAWQATMTAQTERNGQHLPVVQSGAIITDAAGIRYQVPNLIYLPGWVNITGTAAYQTNARLIAEQLSGNFGWGYWLNH